MARGQGGGTPAVRAAVQSTAWYFLSQTLGQKLVIAVMPHDVGN